MAKNLQEFVTLYSAETRRLQQREYLRKVGQSQVPVSVQALLMLIECQIQDSCPVIEAPEASFLTYLNTARFVADCEEDLLPLRRSAAVAVNHNCKIFWLSARQPLSKQRTHASLKTISLP